jgi:hypothetical protein
MSVAPELDSTFIPRPRGRPRMRVHAPPLTQSVWTRFSKEAYAQLIALADREGVSTCEFIREATLKEMAARS